MLDPKEKYTLGDNKVSSKEHADRLNDKLDLKREKYIEKYGLKNEQNCYFALIKIKKMKEEKCTAEALKNLFRKKHSLHSELSHLEEIRYFNDELIPEAERFIDSTPDYQECISASKVDLKTKKGKRKRYATILLRRSIEIL